MEKSLKFLIIVILSFFLLLDAHTSNNSIQSLFCESTEATSEKNQECSIEKDCARLSKFSFSKSIKLYKLSFQVSYKKLWAASAEIKLQRFNIDMSLLIPPLPISSSPVLRI